MAKREPKDDRKPARTPASRAESAASFTGLWVLAVVIAAAALVRIVYLVQYRRLPTFDVPVVDAAYYDSWALRVASGEGYGPMPFYLAPLYPYCLALVYSLFGHQLVLIYVLQVLLGLANLIMVYALGRRFFGHAAGLAAAIVVALYGPLLILETKLLSETLGVFLTLLALLLVSGAIVRDDRPRALYVLGTGLALGVSVICRSSNLLFAALLVVWLAARGLIRRDRSDLRSAVLITAGLALAIAPVTLRNYRVGNDLALIQTNLGMTFAQGNNENARGVFSLPPGASAGIASQQSEEMAMASREAGRQLKPSESSAWWTRRTLAWMRDHPGDFARLLGRKLLYAFNNREELDSYETYYEIAHVPVLRVMAVPFSVILGLGLFGFLRTWRANGNGNRLLGLYLASVLATLLVFYVSSRYRLVGVPVLGVFAGVGVVEAWSSIRNRALPAVGLAVGLLAATSVLGQVAFPMPKSTGAAVLKDVAAHYQEVGRFDKAIAVLREALRVSPTSTELHGELGLALARQGNLPEAIQEYRLALADYPEVAQLRLNLAGALERMGNRPAADEQWQAALRLAPTSAVAHVNVGGALLARGDREQALLHFRQAVHSAPTSAIAHSNLGTALAQLGRHAEALEHFAEAVRLDPNYPRARMNLSMALFDLKRPDEAVANLREGIRLQPAFAPFRYDLARLLAQVGRHDEAIAEYRQLLRLDPKNFEARRQLDALLGRSR